ncbi:multicopper oxidase family protein [Flexibacterium corallicola]|uniref:multicopper oxidase family protein n=1 Tax=Flexibacterium corallicola TaxID=3037259 RepID=UPI00286EFCB4|nr:multicopper oxidase family protein [Pseudovibrio sp. M1P-2-3]
MAGLLRRDVLAGGATALASTSFRRAHAQTTQEANSTSGDKVGMPPVEFADPDFVLNVEEKPLNIGGTSVNALLSGGIFPGTAIRYAEGDTFKVLINNRMSEDTCLHWHGLILPSLMDGVPGIAQLPILAGSSQYYEFPLVQTGSYYYHSHLSTQEQYGLLGPLIIEENNPPVAYDRDVVVMLNDIIAKDGDEVIKSLRSGKEREKPNEPYLPEGVRRFEVDVPYDKYTVNGKPPTDPWLLQVKVGEKLRLRIINASGSSFFRVTIDGLKMTVIESDGHKVKPIVADDVLIGTSERYDVIVEIPESGNYTLHAAAMGDSKQALGVLHTSDIVPQANDKPAVLSGKSVSFRNLESLEPSTLPSVEPRTLDVLLSGNMPKFEWMMNKNYWPEPYAGPNPEKTYLDVSEGEVIRLKMVNKSPMVHPMHLHGHTFRVLGLGGPSAFAPVKDSVWVAPGTTLEIEFYTDNPGLWAYHCHNIWHLVVGMLQPVRYVPKA